MKKNHFVGGDSTSSITVERVKSNRTDLSRPELCPDATLAPLRTSVLCFLRSCGLTRTARTIQHDEDGVGRSFSDPTGASSDAHLNKEVDVPKMLQVSAERCVCSKLGQSVVN
jgi:hypothetical protein